MGSILFGLNDLGELLLACMFMGELHLEDFFFWGGFVFRELLRLIIKEYLG